MGARDRSQLALESAPVPKEFQELTADFHCEPLRGRGTGSPTWYVTARRHVAEPIATLLGGHICQPSNTELVEFATEVTKLAISVSGPEAVQVRWHLGNSPGYCDAGDEPRVCLCPSSLSGRRRAARLGRGCEPHAQVRFRLSGAPLLGLCSFASGNWSFVEDLIAAASLLRGLGGLVHATLSLDRVSGALSTGQAVVFSRPTLTIG
jgi:hypothetical protein